MAKKRREPTKNRSGLVIWFKKEKGWCDENGVAHAWVCGPTLTVDPPIQTRYCENCGKRQQLRPAEWADA